MKSATTSPEAFFLTMHRVSKLVFLSQAKPSCLVPNLPQLLGDPKPNTSIVFFTQFSTTLACKRRLLDRNCCLQNFCDDAKNFCSSQDQLWNFLVICNNNFCNRQPHPHVVHHMLFTDSKARSCRHSCCNPLVATCCSSKHRQQQQQQVPAATAAATTIGNSSSNHHW